MDLSFLKNSTSIYSTESKCLYMHQDKLYRVYRLYMGHDLCSFMRDHHFTKVLGRKNFQNFCKYYGYAFVDQNFENVANMFIEPDIIAHCKDVELDCRNAPLKKLQNVYGVIITEFIDGHTLYDLMNKEKSADFIKSMVVQISNAVQNMIGMGIVHGDIHSRNIIVEQKTGIAKIIDFEFAGDFTNFIPRFGATIHANMLNIFETLVGSALHTTPVVPGGSSEGLSSDLATKQILADEYNSIFISFLACIKDKFKTSASKETAVKFFNTLELYAVIKTFGVCDVQGSLKTLNDIVEKEPFYRIFMLMWWNE
jgi:serine/threonine protein kinase